MPTTDQRPTTTRVRLTLDDEHQHTDRTKASAVTADGRWIGWVDDCRSWRRYRDGRPLWLACRRQNCDNYVGRYHAASPTGRTSSCGSQCSGRGRACRRRPGMTSTRQGARKSQTLAADRFAEMTNEHDLTLVHCAVLLRVLRQESIAERRRLRGQDATDLRQRKLIIVAGCALAGAPGRRYTGSVCVRQGRMAHSMLTDKGRQVATELQALARLFSNTEHEIVTAISGRS